MFGPVRLIITIAALTCSLLFAFPNRVWATAGDLDLTFGVGGRVVYDFTPQDVVGDNGHSAGLILVQPDGKILISFGAPKSASTQKRAYLARLNQDGTLDPNFGNGGKVFFDPLFFSGGAIALQDDGRILVAGVTSPSSTTPTSCALIRLSSDGSLDTTFGSGGRAVTELFAGLRSQQPNVNEEVSAIVVQPDGKIIALAEGSFFELTFRYRTAIARYNSDGTLDSTFGTNGISTQVPFAGDIDGSPRKVILQPDGKFIVCWIFHDASSSQKPPDSGDSLARYNTDGTLDPTFATNAFRDISLSDVALQKDGKVVVTSGLGFACCPTDDQGFRVGRVNSNGSLDTNFGGSGIVSVKVDNNPFHPGVANTVVVQADGKIVAAGVTGMNVNSGGDEKDFALARLNPDGTLDTTFGNAGTIRTDFPASDGSFTSNGVQDLALQLDGKIVAFGLTTPPLNYKLALARYVASGATPTVVQFGSSQFRVIEGCAEKIIAVERSGDTTGISRVDVTTVDATAQQKSDFTLAIRTITFAPGETSKNLSVLISDDGFAEGSEPLTLALSNPVGTAIGARGTAVLQIDDNETVDSTSNAIDDPATFIGEHYHDFLNRQADDSGQAFWTNEITKCGSNPQCVEAQRVNSSAAFMFAIEFYQTGYFVTRIYKSGLGDQPTNPRFVPFMRDVQQVANGVVVLVGNWEQQLKINQQRLAEEFVTRPEFHAAHDSQNADQYINSLFSNAGVIPTAGERNAALTAFGAGDLAGRASALLNVADSGSVYNKLYNESFVLMEYFVYLRRNPDGAPDNSYAGYNFWLAKLNSFTQPGEDVRDTAIAFARVQRSELVRAFIESSEYRRRFGLR